MSGGSIESITHDWILSDDLLRKKKQSNQDILRSSAALTANSFFASPEPSIYTVGQVYFNEAPTAVYSKASDLIR